MPHSLPAALALDAPDAALPARPEVEEGVVLAWVGDNLIVGEVVVVVGEHLGVHPQGL